MTTYKEAVRLKPLRLRKLRSEYSFKKCLSSQYADPYRYKRLFGYSVDELATEQGISYRQAKRQLDAEIVKGCDLLSKELTENGISPILIRKVARLCGRRNLAIARAATVVASGGLNAWNERRKKK